MAIVLILLVRETRRKEKTMISCRDELDLAGQAIIFPVPEIERGGSRVLAYLFFDDRGGGVSGKEEVSRGLVCGWRRWDLCG
jgi:hypothetical protein